MHNEILARIDLLSFHGVAIIYATKDFVSIDGKAIDTTEIIKDKNKFIVYNTSEGGDGTILEYSNLNEFIELARSSRDHLINVDGFGRIIYIFGSADDAFKDLEVDAAYTQHELGYVCIKNRRNSLHKHEFINGHIYLDISNTHVHGNTLLVTKHSLAKELIGENFYNNLPAVELADGFGYLLSVGSIKNINSINLYGKVNCNDIQTDLGKLSEPNQDLMVIIPDDLNQVEFSENIPVGFSVFAYIGNNAYQCIRGDTYVASRPLATINGNSPVDVAKFLRALADELENGRMEKLTMRYSAYCIDDNTIQTGFVALDQNRDTVVSSIDNRDAGDLADDNYQQITNCFLYEANLLNMADFGLTLADNSGIDWQNQKVSDPQYHPENTNEKESSNE